LEYGNLKRQMCNDYCLVKQGLCL